MNPIKEFLKWLYRPFRRRFEERLIQIQGQQEKQLSGLNKLYSEFDRLNALEQKIKQLSDAEMELMALITKLEGHSDEWGQLLENKVNQVLMQGGDKVDAILEGQKAFSKRFSELKAFLNKESYKYLMNDGNYKEISQELFKETNPAWNKWYIPGKSELSATGVKLPRDEKSIREIYYQDLLKFNKQSLAFYSEVIPFFWNYVLELKIPKRKTYTMLDIGARSGAGANLLGEMFSCEEWGYPIKLLVDTIDINHDWNEYIRLYPFIRNSSNRDLYDLEDDSYDFCICSHTIEHLDDPVTFVRQAQRVAKYFALITCPYEERDPIKGHRTISHEILEQCGAKGIRTYKSVNRWKEDLECVVFFVS